MKVSRQYYSTQSVGKAGRYRAHFRETLKALAAESLVRGVGITYGTLKYPGMH
jgi:hypothetical protein